MTPLHVDRESGEIRGTLECGHSLSQVVTRTRDGDQVQVCEGCERAAQHPSAEPAKSEPPKHPFVIAAFGNDRDRHRAVIRKRDGDRGREWLCIESLERDAMGDPRWIEPEDIQDLDALGAALALCMRAEIDRLTAIVQSSATGSNSEGRAGSPDSGSESAHCIGMAISEPAAPSQPEPQEFPSENECTRAYWDAFHRGGDGSPQSDGLLAVRSLCLAARAPRVEWPDEYTRRLRLGSKSTGAQFNKRECVELLALMEKGGAS